MIISSDQRGEFAAGSPWLTVTSVALRYDAVTGVLTEDDALPLPVGHILAVVDLDGDGRDDLVTEGPSAVHWGGEAMNQVNLLESASGEQLLAWKAVNLGDLDQDGLVDLIAQPSGCCTVSCPELSVVLATGRRQYRARPELIETVNHGNVCATLHAPVGDQTVLISFAAIGRCGGASHVFYQQVGVNEEGFPRLEAVPAAGENETFGLALAAPMGGSVADVDGDGDLDLTVTTDSHHVMFRAESEWPMTDVTTWTAIGELGLMLPPEPLAPDRFMVPWSAAFLDLDRDGRVDVLYSHGADPGVEGDEEPVGPQHVTAHWNGGDWRFADVTERLGLGTLGDWRSMTVGDLDGDGDPDLGVGGLAEFPRVYRNDVQTEGRGLALRLRGTTSNPLGLGAIVRVRPRSADPTQIHVMGHMGNPYGVSQPLIFVGLGDVESAAEVEVTWPSGLVQSLSGLEAGRLHEIEEPPTVLVTPWERRLDKDGATSAFVEVYARAPDGALRSGAELTLTIAHGVGTLAGPGQDHEGGRRWEIPPPGVAGSTVVAAEIDGEPVTIRPRIFWE